MIKLRKFWQRFSLWFILALLMGVCFGVQQIHGLETPVQSETTVENVIESEIPSTANTGKPNTAKSNAVAVSVLPPETKIAPKLPTNVYKPINVTVALVVNQIGKITDAAGTFTANLDLRLKWQNPDQAFDPKVIGSNEQILIGEEATARLAKIWQPKVTFQNLADKPREQELQLIVSANGDVTYLQRLTGTFQTSYKLNDFPFDEQILPIALVTKYDRETVNFWQDQEDIDFSRVGTDFSIAGWRIGKMDFVLDQFKGLDANFYSRIQGRIEVKRNPIGHIPGVFIPFFLVLLVPTIITLWLNSDLDKKIGAWSGSILTMVALSFTISVRYPTLSIESVFPQMIWLGFIFQFLGLTFNTTVMNPNLEKFFGGKYIVAEITNFIRWSLPLSLLVMVLRAVLLAMA